MSRSPGLQTDGTGKKTQALSGRRRTHPATSTFRLRQLLRIKSALRISLPSHAPSIPSYAPLPRARWLLPRCRTTLILPSPFPSRASSLSLTPRAVDCRGKEPVDDAGKDG